MNLGRHGRQLISERIDEHLDDFDSAPIHNAVACADDGDGILEELAVAAERAWYAYVGTYDGYEDRDVRDHYVNPLFDAYEECEQLVRDRVDELVAQRCIEAHIDGDQWRGDYDDRVVEESQREAREWLEAHQEAAERLGAKYVAVAEVVVEQ